MRRRHRRVRTSWAGCGCPPGAMKVPTPGVTRGWTCNRPTPKGPRFVRAVCPLEGRKPVQELAPDEGLPAASRRAKKARKKSKAKVDWSKCGCPEGAELRTNAKGSKVCFNEQKRRFVKAECP